MPLFNLLKTISKINPHKITQRTLTSSSQKRTFVKIFRKPSNEKCKIIDKVPEHFKLIYRNGAERYLLYGQIVATGTAGFVLASMLLTGELQSTDFNQEELVYLSAFMMFLIMAYLFVYKMPVRIYYSTTQKKYIFVFFKSLPFTHRQLTTKIGEVEKLEASGILPWNDAKYRVKDQQDVILLENCFHRPADLYIMLGLQRDPEDEP